MVKRTIYIISIVCTILNVKAQQDPLYSQFMYGNMAINPGAAGGEDMACLTGLFRDQWMKFEEGAPNNGFGTFNLPFNLFKASHGVGFQFDNSKIGFNTNTNLNLSYAYRLDMGDGKLGIGVSGGFILNSFKPNWSDDLMGKFQELNKNSDFQFVSAAQDPAVPDGEDNANVLDLGAGLYYKTEKLYFGLSSTHLNQAKIKYVGGEPNYIRHYYISAGYKLPLNSTLDLQPSFIAGSDGSVNQLVVNTNILYNKKVWGGLSYNVGNALIAMIGLELFKDVQTGFAYDFTTSKIRKYGGGSIEVMLRYCFEITTEKLPEGYKSIRYL